MTDATVRAWHENLKAGGEDAMIPYYAILKAVDEGTPMPEVLTNKRLTQSIWENNNAAAEKYNDRGVSRPSSVTSGRRMMPGNNLHRVVVYRDGSDKANEMIPFSSFISPNPEELWKWMANTRRRPAGNCWRSRITET